MKEQLLELLRTIGFGGFSYGDDDQEFLDIIDQVEPGSFAVSGSCLKQIDTDNR